MNYKPLFNKVLVKVIVEETESGGLIMPSTMKNKPDKGEIVSVGGDVAVSKVGDIILFGKNYGIKVLIEDIEYSLIQENDIFVFVN